jgi:DNA-binding NarL/FixJ family response regulator
MTIDLSPRQVEILYSLIAAAEQRLQDEDPTELTARELEVLNLLALGHSRKQIARCLAVTISTINAHVLFILQKLNASNSCHAITIAHQLKILDPSQNT